MSSMKNKGSLYGPVDKILTYLEGILAITDEARLKFTENGLTCNAVDESHTMMVDTVMDVEPFEWDFKEDVELAVNLDKLDSYLSFNKGEKARILVRDDRLRVEVGHEVRKIPTLDIAGVTEPTIPDVDFDNTIRIDGDVLKSDIKKSKPLDDQIEISSEPNVFELYAAAEENDEFRDTFGPDDLEEIEVEEEHSSYIDMEKISALVKVIDDGTVQIRQKTDYPIELQFNKPNITTRYLVAPRIDPGD